ncbi:Protein SDA1 [Blyttiomyces sp. JEL0837]|nr:Protein SDA1 [Blyttiomyces sp. JEL0837]
MVKRSRAEFLASNLPQLQNLIRRDPQSYKEEFLQQWRHWESAIAIFELKPDEERSDFAELINFLAHVAYCYKKEAAVFPQQLINLLSAHYLILHPDLRKAMVQALILLRNKDFVPTTSNAKAKNNKLNKTLQNFMYTMLQDSNEIAARKSLEVMVDLYNKNIWNDAKTVNVISEACFSDRAKMASIAIHFFLGTLDKKEEEEDDDGPDLDALKHQMQINKKKGSKSSVLDKARAAIKRKEARKARAEVFNFSALHLLNDPQGFTEKLFSRLRHVTSTTLFRFDLRLDLINLISRLIGLHKLLVLSFYDFLIPYLKPQQRDVAVILACCAQASHELVPPDAMGTVVQAVADHFVWSNAASEVVTAGLNALREICSRCPLAMPQTLLQSLIEDFKNHKESKGVMMAGRSLLSLYREINPEMLKKRDRGKGASISMKEFKAPAYGSLSVLDTIEGADLLLDDEDPNKPDNNDGDGDNDGWDGWEVESLEGGEEDVGASKKKTGKGKSAAAAKSKGKSSEVVVDEDVEEVGSGDDEEWEDEDEDEEGEGEGEGDGWEGWEEASLDEEDVSGNENDQEEGDIDEGEGDDDDEEDGDADSDEDNESTGPASSSGNHLIGPKQAKLAKQTARRNLEKELEASPAKKQKVLQMSTERIFTDEDFAKMRELAANRKAELMAGIKRSHVQELMDEDEEEGVNTSEVVNVARITSGIKKKMTYEERLASIQEGREGREKFGSKMGKKKQEGASTTNREKAKKTKNPMMIVHKKSVKGKAKRSLREKQKVLRAHITKMKKKGH